MKITDAVEKVENTTTLPLPVMMLRAAVGGVLMGLANLVPGISGGTMLLAAGVYPAFINAIAELTTLRFRARSLVLLGCVIGSAGLAILFLAGLVKGLVVDHRWVMYSLFIGLTLGGVPIVWGMIGRASRAAWAGAAAGFVAMAALAWLQQRQMAGGGVGGSGMVMMFAAGAAGASAMILPGVSGGYLLLVLGQYVPILSAIDRFKEALRAMAVPELLDVGLHVILPVGVGVVVGVVGVSNLLRVLLRRCRQATLGVLLGLLVGAVVGLWPFQEGVKPVEGDIIKHERMTAERLAELEPEDYPTTYFRPSARHLGGSLLFVAVGFAVTAAVARFGGNENEG